MIKRNKRIASARENDSKLQMTLGSTRGKHVLPPFIRHSTNSFETVGIPLPIHFARKITDTPADYILSYKKKTCYCVVFNPVN